MPAARLRARVTQGRLVLDEPTALPDGTVVDLVPLDELDDLEPGDRARLVSFLGESIRSHASGTGVSAGEVLAQVRSAR